MPYKHLQGMNRRHSRYAKIHVLGNCRQKLRSGIKSSLITNFCGLTTVLGLIMQYFTKLVFFTNTAEQIQPKKPCRNPYPVATRPPYKCYILLY